MSSFIGLILVALSAVTAKEPLQFEYIAEQQHDSSCGYAVISSVLSFYTESGAVPEAELISEYPPGEKHLAISFARMNRILSDYGIESRGFAMTSGQLSDAIRTFAPCIVHFDSPTDHFALVIGKSGRNYIVADPAEGTRIYGPHRFLLSWSGKVLVPNVRVTDRSQEVIDRCERRLRLLEGAFR